MACKRAVSMEILKYNLKIVKYLVETGLEVVLPSAKDHLLDQLET